MNCLYVGIDVSKATLDVVVRVENTSHKAKTYANDTAGIAALLGALRQHGAETVYACLEATGQYGDELAETLYLQGVRVSVVNPLRPKRYAQSDLLRNQNDKVDAAILAEFVQVKQPRLWNPPSPAHKALRALSRRLDDLQSMLQMERNRLKATKAHLPSIQDGLERMLAFLKSEIQLVKRQLQLTIQSDPELLRQQHLLQSIPGVGLLTAIRFLAEVGDLRQFASAKQLAAFLGLTPSNKTSGSSVRTKPQLSKKGLTGVRHLLYMPAVVAKRYNPIVRAFCERLKAAQKVNLSIIAAAMHKLVHLMFGVVHSGKPFDPLFLQKAAFPS